MLKSIGIANLIRGKFGRVWMLGIRMHMRETQGVYLYRQKLVGMVMLWDPIGGFLVQHVIPT